MASKLRLNESGMKMKMKNDLRYILKVKIGITCSCGTYLDTHQAIDEHITKNPSHYPFFKKSELSDFFGRLVEEWEKLSEKDKLLLENKKINPSRRNQNGKMDFK